MANHRVFISYYHKDDEDYRKQLEKWNSNNRLFENMSVGSGDIDDRYMTDEQIRREIRDNYINTATVLILLCGTNTRKRKHIDWEIHMAMTDYDDNPQMGIVLVNLPDVGQRVIATDDVEKRIVGRNITSWSSIGDYDEITRKYPHYPFRIRKNLAKGVSISSINWSDIGTNLNDFKELIDIAFKRRKNQKYDFSDKLMEVDEN